MVNVVKTRKGRLNHFLLPRAKGGEAKVGMKTGSEVAWHCPLYRSKRTGDDSAKLDNGMA
jgi:hypothetical protein